MKSPRDYRFGEYYIPDYMVEPLERWIAYGIYPGSFLAAVLENDLKGALGKADATNLKNFPAFVAYLYNEAPSTCWGSPQKVRTWKGTQP